MKFAISHSVQSNRLEMGIFDICETGKIAMQFFAFVLISIRVIEQIIGTSKNSPTHNVTYNIGLDDSEQNRMFISERGENP